jgi:hypothetical protein
VRCWRAVGKQLEKTGYDKVKKCSCIIFLSGLESLYLCYNQLKHIDMKSKAKNQPVNANSFWTTQMGHKDNGGWDNDSWATQRG